MRNIRIGKDIALEWRVLVNGKSVDLSGLDLALFLHDELRQESRALEFTADGDTLSAKVLGTEQKGTGVYRLTLWLNRGKEGQSVLDESTAFRLVARTEQEGGEDGNNLTTETVGLRGNLSAITGESGGGMTPEERAQLEEATEAVAFFRKNAVVEVEDIDENQVFKSADGEIIFALPPASEDADGYLQKEDFARFAKKVPKADNKTDKRLIVRRAIPVTPSIGERYYFPNGIIRQSLKCTVKAIYQAKFPSFYENHPDVFVRNFKRRNDIEVDDENMAGWGYDTLYDLIMENSRNKKNTMYNSIASETQLTVCKKTYFDLPREGRTYENKGGVIVEITKDAFEWHTDEKGIRWGVFNIDKAVYKCVGVCEDEEERNCFTDTNLRSPFLEIHDGKVVCTKRVTPEAAAEYAGNPWQRKASYIYRFKRNGKQWNRDDDTPKSAYPRKWMGLHPSRGRDAKQKDNYRGKLLFVAKHRGLKSIYGDIYHINNKRRVKKI